MNNMLNKINILREKLERQLLEEKPYNEVLKTSREIDELLVEFYKKETPIKDETLFLIKQN
ncbi:MAG: Spo0E family sporulation regulatory protein-aspartic acid phosphatase [Clostridia bacterium]|nr:Spo0E family sporulation regulatory protein-aspartic acid phosphatase [Clostridia bacterium]